LLILGMTFSLGAQYTLSDSDVVVEEGVITSCSYNFELKNIIIPDTLDGQTVTGIDSWVLFNNGISSVTLPANLETIGDYAFYWNDIATLDLSNCTSLTSIGSVAFSSNNIADLDLTGCTSLKIIGDRAFLGNDIEALDLSSCTSLKIIGDEAFRLNYSLKSFTLPEVTYNGTVYTLWKDGEGNSYNAGIDEVSNFSTFYSVYIVYTLTDSDVVVEEGVITSCSYDFELKNIIIPGTLDGETVTGIGNSVFYNKGIYSVTLPANLEAIGSSAFGSNALIEISLPASLTLIKSSAFSDNNIGVLDLSGCASLTSIRGYAFSSNSIADLDLTSCTSLRSIGSFAFSNNSLTSFILPEVTYNGTVYTLWKDGEGNSYNAGIDEVTNFSTSYLVYILYTLTDDDVVVEEGVIKSCINYFELKNIIIPGTLDGETVKGIGNSVFQNKYISSVTLPSNLETIGDYAFNNNRIGVLDLNPCVSLTSIGRNAFSSNNIADLDLTSCTSLISLGRSAFSSNSLTSFALPDPVIPGYILNYWEDDEGSTHTASEQVTNLYSSYTAHALQFPQGSFFAEYLEVSQTVNISLKFNIPKRGMDISNITLTNNRFNLAQTLPATVASGDTSFSISMDLISPETDLHGTGYELTYVLDGQVKTYSDSLFVAIVLEDRSELSIVGKQAIDAYHACLDSNHVAAQNNMGVIYRLLGGYNKAENIFYEVVSETLESFYGYTGVKMNQGVVESDKKNSAEAMEYYSHALGDLTGEESTSVLAPQIYYNQAWEQYNSGAYSESKNKALETINHQQANSYLVAKAYVLLGACLYSEGDSTAAIENFNKAIEIDSTSIIADIAEKNIWVVTSDIDESISFFSIYPNPNNGLFILRMDEGFTEGKVKLKLYNSSGRLIMNKNIYNLQYSNEFSINIVELPSGLYHLQIVTKKQMLSGSIIIQK